jgi:hypothetical protein
MEIALARILCDQGISTALAFDAAAKFAYTTTRSRGQVEREAGLPFPPARGQTVLAVSDGKAQITTLDELGMHPVFLGQAEALTVVDAGRVFRDVCKRAGYEPDRLLAAVYKDGPRILEVITE